MRINGKDYELRYGMNTLCIMCDNGIDVMNMSSIVVNVKTIRELFMYGIKHDNKKITQNQAGDLIDDYLAEGGSFEALVDEVLEALGKSLGGNDKTEGESEDEEGK